MLKIATENLRPKKLINCPDVLIALMYRSWHSDPNERPTLLFIKKILRLLLNILPKNKQEYSEEIVSEVKKQCTNDLNSLEKYLPYEPRLNNDKSINIYCHHLKKMQNIVDIKQDISKLRQEVNEYSKQNDARYDYHEELLTENQKLQEQIKKLREQKKENSDLI
jgi:chromosome segregation ATPase